MITIFLKYWKFAAGAAGMALIAFALHSVRIEWLKATHEREIASAVQSAVKQCEADKLLTQEVSSEYQSEIANLSRRLADLKRVRPSVCVPVTYPSSRCDATSRAGHAEGNGIDTGTLYDYAGLAEKYRLQLVACQAFINRTWEAKKTPR